MFFIRHFSFTLIFLRIKGFFFPLFSPSREKSPSFSAPLKKRDAEKIRRPCFFSLFRQSATQTERRRKESRRKKSVKGFFPTSKILRSPSRFPFSRRPVQTRSPYTPLPLRVLSDKRMASRFPFLSPPQPKPERTPCFPKRRGDRKPQSVLWKTRFPSGRSFRIAANGGIF